MRVIRQENYQKRLAPKKQERPLARERSRP